MLNTRQPVLAIVTVVLVACGFSVAVPFGVVLFAEWANADTKLKHVVWMDDGWVYAIESRYDANQPLVRLTRDTGPEPVEFAPQGCRSVSTVAIARATTDTLVVAASCYPRTGTYLYAFNPSSSDIREYAHIDYSLANPDDITFSPDLRLGYVNGGICGSVARIEDGLPVPFAEPVAINGHRYPLDAQFFAGGQALPSCRTLFQAPAISGTDLYFAATAGPADRYTLWTAPALIVRMPTPEGTPTIVAEGFAKIRDLTVSSNGRLLVVAAARDDVESTWVVDLSTDRIVKLDAPWTDSASVSPSNQEVVIATVDGDAIFRALS